ncbi:MAG: diaminopimelate epimerase [Cyclobacteriaceae bacterium]
MASLSFYKYQGTGNDFIMFDDRKRQFPTEDIELIGRLCHRRFGIGADGVILIRDHSKADFEMIYFNPDASKSLCGNGSRCAMHFARYLGMIDTEAKFMAIDGMHESTISRGQIHLKMKDVKEIKRVEKDFFIDTGSPHYIKLVEDVGQIAVVREGRTIRNDPQFGDAGTNVNFVEQLNDHEVKIRTYERGVEDETLSCGTGVTAVALAMGAQGMKSPVSLVTRGGILQVTFTQTRPEFFEDIFLIGPAEQVYKGEIEI